MDPVLGLLHALDAPGHLAALVPGLGCSAAAPSPPPPPTTAPVAERRWLREEGLVVLPELASASTAARLVAGIHTLVAARYPAAFVYAFDDAWQLGERVRAAVSSLVGAEYAVAPDIWAWEIPPGRRGWPAHRGMAHAVFDRERPEAVNTWVALSDVGAERSCLSFVPLDDDAHYPAALDRVDAPLERARALPVAAGTALAWNANVLHWGGPCSPRAEGPRVSCSFTLYRADAAERFGPTVALAELDYRRRMEILADQLLVYGEGQPDVSPEVLAWGRTLCAMSSLSGRKEG